MARGSRGLYLLLELSGLLKQHGWCEAFSEVGAAQQSLVFLELYPLTAGNRKEWESRLLVGNVCIYSGPVRVRERERRKKKKKTKRQLRGVPGSGAVTLNHLFSGHTDQQQPRTWAAEDQSFSLDNPKR